MAKRNGKRGNGSAVAAPAYGVMQSELRARQEHYAEITRLEERIAVMRKDAASADASLASSLRAGGAVEPGPLTARLEVEVRKTGGQIRPEWKVEHLRHMEQAHGLEPAKVEADVRLRTERSPEREERIERLVVEEAAK